MHCQKMLGRAAAARSGACPSHIRRLRRPLSSFAELRTSHVHVGRTAAALRTYDRLHGDLLVPREFIVPDDPEWQPDCHGHALGHHLHQARGITKYEALSRHSTTFEEAFRGRRGLVTSDDLAYIVESVAEGVGSTHQWDDVVQPQMQRFFDERQAEATCPEDAEDLFEFGLGMMLEDENEMLEDIVFRGHFVSGYPERVDWLRERGVDSSHVMSGSHLPGAWRGECAWGHCDGDESLHHILCLESKCSEGISWLHTQPYFTEQQKDRMLRELKKEFGRLRPDQDGRIDTSQVPQLARSLMTIAEQHGARCWWDDENEYWESQYWDESELEGRRERPDIEDAWGLFSWIADLERDLANPWGEAGGRYRDKEGEIISSPLWEREKKDRTSAEGIASLRFSCHDTPGYERRLPLQKGTVEPLGGSWGRSEWVPL
jgi:hypothetical protein